MKITFQTKEESKQQQEEEFLKLSKVERFYAFIQLSERVSYFPTKHKIDKNKDNFIIHLKPILK